MTDQIIESAINSKAYADLRKNTESLQGSVDELIPVDGRDSVNNSTPWVEAFEKHEADNGSSIMSDCVLLFPEMFKSCYDKKTVIHMFAKCLLLLTGADTRDTQDTLIRQYKENLANRMMSNLPKDEAPDETIVITGKDISVQ